MVKNVTLLKKCSQPINFATVKNGGNEHISVVKLMAIALRAQKIDGTVKDLSWNHFSVTTKQESQPSSIKLIFKNCHVVA